MQLWGIPPDIPQPIDAEILRLLAGDFEHRPWTVDEITGRIDADPALTLEALIRLRRGEIINSLRGYLILSRPANYYARIASFADDQSLEGLS